MKSKPETKVPNPNIPGDTIYAWRNDKETQNAFRWLSIDEIEFTMVSVSAFEKNVYNITLYLKDPLHYMALRNVFATAYGSWDQPNRYLDNYRWESDNVVLFTMFSPARTASFTYKPLLKSRDVSESNKNKERSKKL